METLLTEIVRQKIVYTNSTVENWLETSTYQGQSYKRLISEKRMIVVQTNNLYCPIYAAYLKDPDQEILEGCDMNEMCTALSVLSIMFFFIVKPSSQTCP